MLRASATRRLTRIAAGAVLLVALPGHIDGSAQVTASSPLPTFGNPTISGIQGYGFEQDLRLDTHGRVYTSAPGGLGSAISYLWRSLDGGQTFKWVPAARQPTGGLPMCNGGGDTELATDSADSLYMTDLTLLNYGTARSSNHGQTLTPGGCVTVPTTPDDRPWYAVDGNPAAGGSITLAYNVAPNATPVDLGNCTIFGNLLAFAQSLPPVTPDSAGLLFGKPKFLTDPTDPCNEGIMGNDEVFNYGGLRRVFVIHDNDALNQIRMGRCDIVPFLQSPDGTGYANCLDKRIADLGSDQVTGGDFPTLAVDRAGDLIAVWEQASCNPCNPPASRVITSDTFLSFAVSTDKGDHWSLPQRLPTPGLATNVFAWPAAGDAGRVDVAWYGTPASACAAPGACGHGPDTVSGDWSLFMVQSLDFTAAASGGTPTWTPPVLASEHFIHRGSIQTLMGGQTGDRVLGDFLQLRIGLQGEANISYADSNSATEALLASQGMFVRQNGGSGVFANRQVVHGAPTRVNAVSMGHHLATFDSLGTSSSNQPNLEILGSRMSVVTVAGVPTYRVETQMADLTSLMPGVGSGGTTLVWDTQWKVPSSAGGDPHGGAYFHAYMESVLGSAPTFWIGQNAVESNLSLTQTYPGSTQVSGTYTPTAPGVITIDVPVSAVTEASPINKLLYSVTSASMTLTGNAETPPSIFGSGVGGNVFSLVDAAPAYDFNPDVQTPPFQNCHEADGDGQVHGVQSGTASFHVDSDRCEDGQPESVTEQDPGSGTDFHSTDFTRVTFDDVAHSATIIGDGTDAGHPVTFMMFAVDNGLLPGIFSLSLSDGYSVTGSLLSGSIQLR
jgi:hypothetical protein